MDGDDIFEPPIPAYNGTKISCAMCEHHFKIGDYVMVCEAEDILLCPTNKNLKSFFDGTNCPLRWVLENKRPVLARLMIFHGITAS